MSCAYCKSDVKMTREHIIPKFIYDFHKNQGARSIGWNARVEKLLEFEAIISDVCQSCNNGALAGLDAYGKNFLINHRILTNLFLKRKITLRYNYNSLVRWLLKLSYNAARTRETYNDEFKDHIDYILGIKDHHSNKLIIFTGLLSPQKLEPEISEKFKVPVSHDNLSGPFRMRLTQNALNIPIKGLVVRGVYFGSVFFHIAFIDDLQIENLEKIVNSYTLNMNCNHLANDSSSIELHASERTWFTESEAQFLHEIKTMGIDKAREFINKNSLK